MTGTTNSKTKFILKVKKIIYYLFALLDITIIIRFFFKLFGANSGNSFVSFLYNVSEFFVKPFQGIFNQTTFGSGSVFESASVLAVIIYTIIAYAVLRLYDILFLNP